jgi:hypothetical protein
VPRILEPLCGPRAALPERPISHLIQVAYAEGPTALPRVSIEGHPINHTFSNRKVAHTLLRDVSRPPLRGSTAGPARFGSSSIRPAGSLVTASRTYNMTRYLVAKCEISGRPIRATFGKRQLNQLVELRPEIRDIVSERRH